MDKFVRRTPRKSDTSPLSDHQYSRSEDIQPRKKARLSDHKAEPDVDLKLSVKIEDTNDTYFPDLLVESVSGHDACTALEASLHLDASIPETEAFVKEEEKELPGSNEDGDSTAASTRKPLWVKGESSMYVDAFNMALDTVLRDEAHLFDEQELQVFRQWRAQEYAQQYLYVRLFLRKTAAWHRISRLGYYDELPDVEAACRALQDRIYFTTADTKKNSTAVVEPAAPPASVSTTTDDSSYGDSFTFADTSAECITSVSDAVSLLSLEELKTIAKEEKLRGGKTKSELAQNIVHVAHAQTNLLSLGVTRRLRSSPAAAQSPARNTRPRVNDGDGVHDTRLLGRILAIPGPCIRLSRQTVRLFERVHLVFFRSTQWTEKSLTTSILASISRQNFPVYLVHRSSTIFASRAAVVEFEAALRLEAEMDALLEIGTAGFSGVMDIFDKMYPRWRTLLAEETAKDSVGVYEYGEGVYLRRFSAAHTYTRLVHKGAYVLGRLKEYEQEHSLLCELLGQRLFHPARRGAWYQRKALLEEHYMHTATLANTDIKVPTRSNDQAARRIWRQKAAETCERALQDNECHVIFHYDLQKRLVKLEKQLCIPRRLQHDFGHLNLRPPLQHTIEGIQLKPCVPGPSILPTSRSNSANVSMRTWWLDEFSAFGSLTDNLEDTTTGPISVEDMCLSWYRANQGWKGYHSEGGIVRTLFAYLFFDILFLPVANVFQTAYQSCPLDLFTDAFYCARISEINQRLAEISNGQAAQIIADVIAREGERRPVVIGLNWDFAADDVLELAQCFKPEALTAVCRVLAQEYRARSSGLPDLILWRVRAGEETHGDCMFVEVKSASDRVSDTQRLWMHVLGVAGVTVAVCHAVARETREV